MKKNNQTMLMSKISETASILPSQDVLKFMKVLGEAYRENQITEREIAKLQAQREILLTEIQRKYDLYEKVFEQIFDQRKMAIQKSFDVIDHGLKSNDRELISSGLHSLSQVVSSSPFANVEQLSSLLESDKIIEI